MAIEKGGGGAASATDGEQSVGGPEGQSGRRHGGGGGAAKSMGERSRASQSGRGRRRRAVAHSPLLHDRSRDRRGSGSAVAPSQPQATSGQWAGSERRSRRRHGGGGGTAKSTDGRSHGRAGEGEEDDGRRSRDSGP
jgi:hypothetical protein